MEISNEVLQKLIAIVGETFVFTDMQTRKHYGHDETEDFVFPPHVVVKPLDASQISEILILANQYQIPVTPIGGRTGLSGGALCIYKGIGLSMERFDKIIEIDEQNLQVTVEPAVITQVLRESVLEKGYPFPSGQNAYDARA